MKEEERNKKVKMRDLNPNKTFVQLILVLLNLKPLAKKKNLFLLPSPSFFLH
jgi:hypothetical protein